MNHALSPIPKSAAAAASLSLLTMLFGFSLGGAFGAFEGPIKKHLMSSAAAVSQSAYAGNTATMDSVVKKSWEYLQRAHLHGGALGTAALASIAILLLLCDFGRLERLSALAFSSGAFMYSLFWLFAGLRAPSLGSTSLAKESLAFIAIPGAGLCLLGACGTIAAVLKAACRPAVKS